jgi:hypothetical protein
MSQRGQRLQATADAQVARLIDLVGAVDDASLARRCRGRDKLGDGTIGALAAHIAAFVATSAEDRHAPMDGGVHGPTSHGDADSYTAANTTGAALVNDLSVAREGLAWIAALADAELDSVPDEDSFKFCDGERTLEEVLSGLLKHQGHQVHMLEAAIS